MQMENTYFILGNKQQLNKDKGVEGLRATASSWWMLL